MGTVIGPVLTRADGYRFDTWTGQGGDSRLSLSPDRRRTYARNAEIKSYARGRAPAAIVCQTLDEFIAKSTGYEMFAAA